MTIKDEVDRAVDAYHGDDLQAVTVGFDLWEAFCQEIGMEPKPVFDGLSDVEVIYRGMSVRPGVSPDRIMLITGE
jgi:hypothetical protein